ncbi:hypothetical protein ACNI3K_05250 [Demequina sp. SO4-13]|uniref:hypothetical protein n=1 Tax=Demequina sp. SO4-13 TaxID=3401027 RepID=UPI003AF5B117
MSRRAAGAVACVLVLAACGSGSEPVDREADAVGTAAAVDAAGEALRVEFEPDPGYEYFEGTEFAIDDEVTVVGDADLEDTLRAGDRLAVWTEVCAESFPVQCKVEAVEVLD